VALNNLILHFGTATPNLSEDYAVFYWDLWWVKHALVDLHTNPMLTNYILFPNTVNLTLHTHVFTLGLISLPFQPVLDLHWIVNGWVVVSFLLNSSLTFVFLRRHIHNTGLCILGATIYAFSPGLLWRATQVHLNTLAVWWLPLNLLLWDLALERRSVRWALALGASFYLAFMNYSEIGLWILLTLAPYMLYGFLAQTSPPARWQVVRLGLAAVLAALLPALVMPIPQLVQVDSKELPWEDLRTVHYFSFPIAALFTRLQDVGENNTLGQTLPALVLVSLAFTGKRRDRWVWLGAGLVSLVLALGPYLDNPSQPLPFMLIYNLSHGQYRTPIRLTTPTTLALVVFVIYSLANLFDRLQSRWTQTAIVAALMAIYCLDVGILSPFPIRTVPDYPVYRIIGADPEDHTLLQVPIGAASGSRGVGPGAQLAYYARFHHQRTVNGLVSRVPAIQLALFERTPFLRALATLNPLPPFEEARTEFVKKLKSWDIRYIVVHKDLLKPEGARPFIEFFNEQPELCVFDDALDTIAYRSISSWAECPRPDLIAVSSGGKLNLGDPGDNRFIGLGWYDAENVGGPQARWAGEIVTSTLHLVLPSQSVRVHFRAAAYPIHQTVTILVNGTAVTIVNLGDDWAEYDFTLPADNARDQRRSVITLIHAHLESPFERTGDATLDHRPLAAAYDYFTFEPVR
jgi:hypothetical protein